MQEIAWCFMYLLFPNKILLLNGQEAWTKRARVVFASCCSNESVQAILLESTRIKWPMHIVQLRLSKTQEVRNLKLIFDTCTFAPTPILLVEYCSTAWKLSSASKRTKQRNMPIFVEHGLHWTICFLQFRSTWSKPISSTWASYILFLKNDC